jgi:histidinol-phosphatase (PHP family)
MKIIDYHIHSNYSLDARDSMVEIVATAIKSGISEIVFTDHIEFFVNDYNGIEASLKKQYLEFLDLKDKYSKEINLKFGMEVAQQLYNPIETQTICSMLPYDFILFSLHRIRGGEDYYDMDYRNIDIEAESKKYILELEELVDSFDCFSVLGHIDYLSRYIKKFNLDFSFNSLKYSFEPIFRKLIKNGKGIEVNTSGLRTNHQLTMPSKEILELYFELGGEILTIGSDSHKKEEVGANYFKIIDLIKKIGFKKIAKFNKMQVEYLEI